MLTRDKAPVPITVDLARLPMLLTTLRLPTIGQLWPTFTERPIARAGRPRAIWRPCSSIELAERDQRRIQRHLQDARLPSGKTLRQLRLRHRPDGQQGPDHRARPVACLARQRHQHPAVRPTRRRQVASRRSPRPCADRQRLSRAVHPHHRPGPAAAGRAAGDLTLAASSTSSTSTTC